MLLCFELLFFELLCFDFEFDDLVFPEADDVPPEAESEPCELPEDFREEAEEPDEAELLLLLLLLFEPDSLEFEALLSA